MAGKTDNAKGEAGAITGPAGGSGQEPEKDKMDELLSDVPEWLRGPVKQYYRQAMAAVALLVLAVSLWSGYSYYSKSQEAAASFQLGIAMATNTMDRKIEELKKIQGKFSHTSAARIAGLLIGQVYLQKHAWNAAHDAFKKAERDFSGIMADTAAMGQGYSLEEEKQLDAALSEFQKVAKRGKGMEAVATMDEARIYQELGRKKEAVDAYNRYLDIEPMSPLLDFIRFQVINLSS